MGKKLAAGKVEPKNSRLRSNDRPLDDVLKLPDIARPIVLLQLKDFTLGQSRPAAIELDRCLLDKMGGQQRNVLLAVS